MCQGVVECCSNYFRSISYSYELYKTKIFCLEVNTSKICRLEIKVPKRKRTSVFFCKMPTYFPNRVYVVQSYKRNVFRLHLAIMHKTLRLVLYNVKFCDFVQCFSNFVSYLKK